jgi:hypothetical protein
LFNVNALTHIFEQSENNVQSIVGENIMHPDIEKLAIQIEKLDPMDIHLIMHLVDRLQTGHQPSLLCLVSLCERLGEGTPKYLECCTKGDRRQL